MRLRRRFYQVLEVAAPGDKLSRAVDLTVLAVILLSITMIVVETAYPKGIGFDQLETGIVAFFTLELLLRIWCSVENPRFSSHPIWGRIRFMITPFAIIDVLAIAPWYAATFGLVLVQHDNLRVLRILRLFKATRYSSSMRTIGNVFYNKRGELASILLVLFIMLLVISTLMFYVEKDVQEDAFGSIPAAMWWGVITLTTVGYGDVGPITVTGKFFGGLIAVLGIGIFALPAGILGAAFVEEMGKRDQPRPELPVEPEPRHETTAHYCPHCGKDVHTPPV